MKAFLLALLMVALAAGGVAYANPVVNPAATMENQRPMYCESGVILRYDYEGGDKGYWIVVKKPNQDKPRLVIYFAPGQDRPRKAYLDGKEVDLEETLSRPPCDFFK